MSIPLDQIKGRWCFEELNSQLYVSTLTQSLITELGSVTR